MRKMVHWGMTPPYYHAELPGGDVSGMPMGTGMSHGMGTGQAGMGSMGAYAQPAMSGRTDYGGIGFGLGGTGPGMGGMSMMGVPLGGGLSGGMSGMAGIGAMGMGGMGGMTGAGGMGGMGGTQGMQGMGAMNGMGAAGMGMGMNSPMSQMRMGPQVGPGMMGQAGRPGPGGGLHGAGLLGFVHFLSISFFLRPFRSPLSHYGSCFKPARFSCGPCFNQKLLWGTASRDILGHVEGIKGVSASSWRWFSGRPQTLLVFYLIDPLTHPLPCMRI